MQNKRIVYENDEGGISIVVPAPNCTEEQAIKAVPKGTPYKIVDVKDIPSDRTFRNAWCKHESKALDIDMDKAKNITHEKRRLKRQEEFAPLDQEVVINMADSKKLKDSEDKRVAVRQKYETIQSDIDGCTSVEQLKAVIDKEGL